MNAFSFGTPHLNGIVATLTIGKASSANEEIEFKVLVCVDSIVSFLYCF
jgi:hypothetical protein